MFNLIYGLSPYAISNAIASILALLTLIYTIKIPFKRSYHLIFLIYATDIVLWTAAGLFAHLADDPDVFTKRIWWGFLLGAPFALPLPYSFVLYFVTPKLTKLQKYTLVATYAYLVFFWVMLFLDPTRIYTRPKVTELGFRIVAGSSAQLFSPFGINLASIILVVLAFTFLSRYYRSNQSQVVRGQIRYLAAGILVYVLGVNSFTIAQLSGGFSLLSIGTAVGSAIMMMGFRKHGFVPVLPRAEASLIAVSKSKLEGGLTYLALEPDAKRSFELFTELTHEGRLGLCVTRLYPDKVRQTFGLEATPIRWLAEEKRDDTIAPGDLLGLSLTIKDFLQKATKPVVLLHGLEYLASINDFGPILRLLQRINDVNAQKDGILIIPLLPNSLHERDMALLRAETTPLTVS